MTKKQKESTSKAVKKDLLKEMIALVDQLSQGGVAVFVRHEKIVNTEGNIEDVLIFAKEDCT
jgi:hypothetical protein